MFKKFFSDIRIEVTLYDTLPDYVAARALAYRTECLSQVLRHWYNPARVAGMAYSDRPLWAHVPRRQR